jgi:hypothetical protein
MAEEAMSDTLKELLARVEAATGPDREIDAELIRIVWRQDPTAWIMTNTTIPAYTASLDAIIALVEKTLPGWLPGMVKKNSSRGAWECYVRNDEPLLSGYYAAKNPKARWLTGYGPTAPLGLLSALLQALISNSKTEGAG